MFGRRASAVPRISRIKFGKITAEARRLNQTFKSGSGKQLSSTSSAVLHDCNRTKFINYMNVFSIPRVELCPKEYAQ